MTKYHYQVPGGEVASVVECYCARWRTVKRYASTQDRSTVTMHIYWLNVTHF